MSLDPSSSSYDENDIPVVTCFFWKYDEIHGNVIIKSKERVSQNLILNRPSSQLWLSMNGKNTIAAIRSLAPDFDLDQFLQELESYGLISYKRKLEEDW